MAKAIPEGYHSVTPYLIVKGAARALEFYKKAFNATELVRMEGPGGTIGHAEFQIGNSIIMLGDENAEFGARSPETIGGSPVGLCIYIEDVDTIFKRAIAAGGKEERPVQDQFYGDRSGTLRDPFGHQWTIATHMEDVSPEEMERRMKAMKPK
ncbi:VOC family protein [Hyalangium sp.]|uniref:VOC family protein n=1 Tax=Hyalangium sp. TaxID=2028555 RepID=UPI002D4069F0|nr:VOC family protein [Hyalangium sp.]HYI02664.1 VOC family protein [Hyalangium sp.]